MQTSTETNRNQGTESAKTKGEGEIEIRCENPSSTETQIGKEISTSASNTKEESRETKTGATTGERKRKAQSGWRRQVLKRKRQKHQAETESKRTSETAVLDEKTPKGSVQGIPTAMLTETERKHTPEVYEHHDETKAVKAESPKQQGRKQPGYKIETAENGDRKYRNRTFPRMGDLCSKCHISVAAENGFGFTMPYTWCQTCKYTLNDRRYRSTLGGYLNGLYHQIRQREREGGYSVSITQKDLKDLWEIQQGKCALTQMMMLHTHDPNIPERLLLNASVDRIDSTKNYDLENIQLLCLRLNIMKGALPQSKFIQFCHEVAKVHPAPPPSLPPISVLPPAPVPPASDPMQT